MEHRILLPYALRSRPRRIILGHRVASTSNRVARAEVSRVAPAIEAVLQRLSHLRVEEAVKQRDGESLNTE